MNSGCLFCRISAGEIPANLIHADETVFAFHDINPQAPHHVLICPRRHIGTLDEVRGEDEQLMGRLVTTASMLARKLGLPSGGYRLVINCGAGAGQSVFHVHVHLLGGRPFAWPPG
ncbi:MAG: histidine triad nucleotide-binding protein [Candidatus Polarisedimenticolia bacterium]